MICLGNIVICKVNIVPPTKPVSCKIYRFIEQKYCSTDSTVLYCTVLTWCTVLYSTVLYYMVKYGTVLYCTVEYDKNDKMYN